MPIWLITGTTSGFGREFVSQLLARGEKVIATARTISKIADLKNLNSNVAVLELDVTSSQDELNDKAKEAIEIFGGVDVLVNNAGFTQFGFLEEMNEDDYPTQFATNLFGPVNLTRSFLPHFRARGSGVIVNIGSMAAWETTPGLGAYSASKAALRYATEALNLEISPLGIKTLLVEPGQFRTDLLSPQNSNYAESGIPAYTDSKREIFDVFRNVHSKQRGDVAKGVAGIIDVVKGEGEAKGREWLGELVLGIDAVEGIRAKCEATLNKIKEWEGVSCSTDIVE
ncbi:putative short-chain oxidoreductase [Aspergillus stella-maris]|uniref:putative short-chain oxidoreductase n=1 Tax=Aspergillus stella-maris TaxID=1810926 RepID=UPI003CCD4B79